MKNLWAPWREKFVAGKKEKGCIFCKRLKEKKDQKNFILYRGKNAFVILNLYPYNSGHLMVVAQRHKAKFEDLTPPEAFEMMQLSQAWVKNLKKALKPDGINLGINMNKAAGAGIHDHVHIHLVPRWNGDTNFMSVLTETKVISVSLNSVYKKLKAKR
ncbi:MAG TPA: HIT domain-containing protein [candidate division Zixibacteria bacterium]|nr:HIT domain-containing protein [candidate division Zixibacteria bacterium]